MERNNDTMNTEQSDPCKSASGQDLESLKSE